MKFIHWVKYLTSQYRNQTMMIMMVVTHFHPTSIHVLNRLQGMGFQFIVSTCHVRMMKQRNFMHLAIRSIEPSHFRSILVVEMTPTWTPLRVQRSVVWITSAFIRVIIRFVNVSRSPRDSSQPSDGPRYISKARIIITLRGELIEYILFFVCSRNWKWRGSRYFVSATSLEIVLIAQYIQ